MTEEKHEEDVKGPPAELIELTDETLRKIAVMFLTEGRKIADLGDAETHIRASGTEVTRIIAGLAHLSTAFAMKALELSRKVSPRVADQTYAALAKSLAASMQEVRK